MGNRAARAGDNAASRARYHSKRTRSDGSRPRPGLTTIRTPVAVTTARNVWSSQLRSASEVQTTRACTGAALAVSRSTFSAALIVARTTDSTRTAIKYLAATAAQSGGKVQTFAIRCAFATQCCYPLPRKLTSMSIPGTQKPYVCRALMEQGRRDSNPQPPVLETGALPIVLLP
jgi:hypothetical protein